DAGKSRNITLKYPEIRPMAKQILFVQGAGESVHDAWDDKLVRSLERELGDAFRVTYPRMPGETDPRYADWKATLLEQFERLEDGAVLVGHSIGGAILIHVLAEQLPRRTLGAIALIAAPFIGDGGWPSEDIEPCPDLGKHLPDDVPVFLYHGTADTIVPFAHVTLYAKAIPQASVRALANRDHQLDNDLGDVARDIRSLVGRTGAP
ncbi:MAG TPA: alpha/beta fold hydrolase, partial [Rhodanobacteraceae bacterium]|nr:alpha/beta fold hydrolase [Rhodanobacteraceae bacterium]